MDCLKLVKQTCAYVSKNANVVKLNNDGITALANELTSNTMQSIASPKAFNSEIHLVEQGDLTIQYLLVVDTLNFCFWPNENFEYDALAKSVKAATLKDPNIISAQSLLQMTQDKLLHLAGDLMPDAEERVRLLRETGSVLTEHFEGLAANMVRKSNNSASTLVNFMTTFFRGFQDHAVYSCIPQIQLIQVCCIQGADLGFFHDIDQLTMFADYRVPVILKEKNILLYDNDLYNKICSKTQLIPSSENEIEIRAQCIVAVESLKKEIKRLHGINVLSIQLDWYLWQLAENEKDKLPQHHLVHTVYY